MILTHKYINNYNTIIIIKHTVNRKVKDLSTFSTSDTHCTEQKTLFLYMYFIIGKPAEGTDKINAFFLLLLSLAE